MRNGFLLACLLVAPVLVWAGEADPRAAAEAFLKPLGPLPADKYAIALLKDDSLPNHDPKLADEFADLLRKGGHEVTLINADHLCNPFLVTTARFDMLFLPSCHTLPGEAGPVIKAYCDKGGDLAALGTPAFRNTLAKIGGRWLSKDDWRKLLNAQPTARVLFSFDDEDLSKWQRHTNAPDSPITRELVPGQEGKALQVVIPNMTGWDGFASPNLDKPFPPGHTLTCLWAKAGDVGGGSVPRDEREKTRGTEAPPTDKLMLEWRERDGSRWIATFSLKERGVDNPSPSQGEGREKVGPQDGPDPKAPPSPSPSLKGRGVEGGWTRIVLAPSDFKFWQSVPTRGGPGDCFKPENAEQLVLGVAHTHTGPRTGRYEFLIDQLGTAPAPPGLSDVEGKLLPPPILENFSPSYKFYAIHEVESLWRRSAWRLGDYGEPLRSLPKVIYAHHTRPTGKGLRKHRTWRWIPLVEARGADGPLRGIPCSLYVDFTTSGIRFSLGVDAPEWLTKPWFRELVADAVNRTSAGVFFQEAGSPFFTYRLGDDVPFGGTAGNLSRFPSPNSRLEYELALAHRVQERHDFFNGTRLTLTIAPRRMASGMDKVVTPFSKPSDEDKILGVSLCRDREREFPMFGADRLAAWRVQHRFDVIRHEVSLFVPTLQAQRTYVKAQDGDFWLDGKKWYPHGVNYMPSTGIGVEDNEYFEYWLDAKAYDPEFVQRDLERIKAVGFNSVSIFIYHRSLPANNLLDFLRRCDELGLKVNLSLRPGTPMDYKWEQWKEIIEKNRLWEQDVIWAYDIAWEPFFGTEAERKRYDPLWREWLVKKYGSLDAAKRALGLKDEITGPTGWQLTNDGEHRKFVAGYRRFADELVHERYLDAYKKIKAIDPNHLISFRMTVTGDPTFNDPGRMPYDFKGVAKAMDFLAPEGYGRVGDWEKVKAGIFTVAYARACAPEKPVFWAEAGVSAWDEEAMAATPEKLDFQARFYRDFYRMMLASHSNGVAWWWYPGGYRVNERSDYGIINPDGTDRPVTRVIRELGPKLAAERVLPKPDTWIEIDRDADARGLFGVYEKVKGEFWRAVEQGRTVGLRCVTRDP